MLNFTVHTRNTGVWIETITSIGCLPEKALDSHPVTRVRGRNVTTDDHTEVAYHVNTLNAQAHGHFWYYINNERT